MLITTFMSKRATMSNDADALQSAMIATRDKYPDPYFWAGFVLNGLPNE
jgi:CHAT domain-containing protein